MRLAIPNPITGRHVLIYLMGFFGVIFVANIIYIYLALSTFTGEHTVNAYDKGLAYNSTLAAAEEQKALPWSALLSAEPSGPQTLDIDVSLQGAAPTDLSAEVTVRRPTLDGYDQVIALQATSAAHHSTRVVLPFSGVWDLDVTLTQDGTAVYRQTTRAVVP